MTQTLVAGDPRRAIAQIALAPGTETGLVVMSVQLPLGISIPAGVHAVVDDGDAFSLPLLRCLRSGCLAARPLTLEEVAELRTGSAIALSFVGAPGTEVTLPVSLAGITAGLDATGWDR